MRCILQEFIIFYEPNSFCLVGKSSHYNFSRNLLIPKVFAILKEVKYALSLINGVNRRCKISGVPVKDQVKNCKEISARGQGMEIPVQNILIIFILLGVIKLSKFNDLRTVFMQYSCTDNFAYVC